LEFTPVPLFEEIYSKFQFICGAVFDERKYEWVLSMGLDDLYCAVVTISHTKVLRALTPIADIYELVRITKSDLLPSVGPASTSLDEVAEALEVGEEADLEAGEEAGACTLVVSELDQTALA
jgi:hypothetical protein